MIFTSFPLIFVIFLWMVPNIKQGVKRTWWLTGRPAKSETGPFNKSWGGWIFITLCCTLYQLEEWIPPRSWKASTSKRERRREMTFKRPKELRTKWAAVFRDMRIECGSDSDILCLKHRLGVDQGVGRRAGWRTWLFTVTLVDLGSPLRGLPVLLGRHSWDWFKTRPRADVVMVGRH